MMEYLFFLVSLIEVFGEIIHSNTLRFIAKPLLMIALVAFYIQSVKGDWNKIHKLMVAAFFFSWVGDVALMFEYANPNFFLVGLVGFLITHILYAVAFANVTKKQASVALSKKLWMIIPLAIYMVLLLSLLVPGISANEKTKPFLAPVLVYSTAISVMVAFAINRIGRVNELSFKLVAIGALLFMFSDSIIAVNKFLQPLPFASVFIMILYIIGQYLIAKGMLAQFSETKS